MRFSVQRSVLADVLSAAFAATATKHAVGVIAFVKVSASDGKLTLVGTDLEIELSTSCNAEVSEPGEAIVSHRLVAVCREAVGDTVTIESTESGLQVSCGSGVWNLSSPGNATDFPAYRQAEPVGAATVGAADLKRAFRLTDYACDPNSMRFALGGVLMEFEKSKIELAATDTSRIAVLSIGANWDSKKDCREVIPLKAVKQLERVLSDGDVRIACYASYAAFFGDGWELKARYIEGKFPDYGPILSGRKDCQTVFHVVADTFARAVRAASICTTEESIGVKIELRSGEVSVSASGADVGVSKVVVPVAYEGEPASWSFNGKLLTEFLKRVDPLAQIEIAGTDMQWFMSTEGVIYVSMGLDTSKEEQGCTQD